MALQTSGQISLDDLHVEAGGTTGTQCSFNDSDIRDLISKTAATQMAMNEWYGATAETVMTSAGTVNGQDQQKQISVSSFISAGGTLRIPSNIWVWSNSTSTPALTIDISCTIVNEGKIIGRGGNGGTTGGAGGPAIKINSGVTGVTIKNQSGAYIAGGGGGGGRGNCTTTGGGGAGGGSGKYGGGSLNATGSNGGGVGGGSGGGAGGGGHGYATTPDYFCQVMGSGAGGRILPGTGGSGGSGGGGSGGSAGNAGGNGGGGFGGIGAGGGAGWGATGGTGKVNGTPFSGGAGGKAVDDSGVSYTLTNNGTVYGGT